MGYGKAFGWILRRSRIRFRCAVALSLAVKALNFVILAPFSALILRFCLMQWGRASVGNFEIASFLVSPLGLFAVIGVGALTVSTHYLELAALIRLLACDELHWWEAFKGSTKRFHRQIYLGLRLLLPCLALAVPFLAAIGLVYWLLWSGRDLNGLIILKPSEFWWGAGIAGAFAVVYGLLVVRLLLRRIYALPIVTFEQNVTVSGALRSSIQRSEGTLWRCAGAIAFWAAAQFLTTTAVLAVTHFVVQSTLLRVQVSLAITVLFAGTAVFIHLLIATILSVLATVTFAGVMLELYHRTAPADVFRFQETGTRKPNAAMRGWVLGAGLAVFAAFAMSTCLFAVHDLKLQEPVEITAHRAGATHAPENTVAALKRAIADGADWAEVDVQLTLDQALVVMHDIDLARVGGGKRRVDQTNLADIQALDVGSAMGEEFAGERIPTLDEILSAADRKIKLNVELKPHNSQDGNRLTRRVIEELQRAAVVDNCRLCSQSYDCLQLARRIEPRLVLGYIVGASVGSPEQLDVDFLMVKSSLATRQFVDRARVRKISIHAWTVNDPDFVPALVDAGVANLITDDPALIRQRLDEIRSLNTVDRLLLRVRNTLNE